MRGTTPEVETVTRRGESPGNTSVRERTAASTASRLSRGSPIPMKTTFVASSPAASAASRATRNWCTISPAVRFRRKPMVAVAQKAQARVHPDCDDTHTVPRVREGIRTVSALWPSPNSIAHLVVPSSAVSLEDTRTRGRTSEVRSGPRIGFGDSGDLRRQRAERPGHQRASQGEGARVAPPTRGSESSRVRRQRVERFAGSHALKQIRAPGADPSRPPRWRRRDGSRGAAADRWRSR